MLTLGCHLKKMCSKLKEEGTYIMIICVALFPYVTKLFAKITVKLYVVQANFDAVIRMYHNNNSTMYSHFHRYYVVTERWSFWFVARFT